ncbi:MAG: hypothetical protein AAF587_08845 [Bacteroidota bacterium]
MPRIQDSSVDAKNFFTERQLEYFGKELEQAGYFDKLMVEKEAAHWKNGQFIVIQYSDPKEYQAKYLTGVYANAPFHTDIPYRFWDQMLQEWRVWKRCKKNMN